MNSDVEGMQMELTKYKTISLILMISLLLMGAKCQPLKGAAPKDNHEYWYKAGSTEIERREASLECGFKASQYEYASHDYNVAIINSFKCMQKAGFVKESEPDFDFCDLMKNDGVPLCSKPLSAAPDRSVERRLDHVACRRYAGSPACQPHWKKGDVVLSPLASKKAYLECSFYDYKQWDSAENITDIIKGYNCMFKAGFEVDGAPNYHPCNFGDRKHTLPICSLPLSDAAESSIERRLNHRYCYELHPEDKAACQR